MTPRPSDATMVPIDCGHAHALRAEHQSRGWNAQRVRGGGNMKMDFGEGAGPELAAGIVRLEFNKSGPGGKGL